MNLYQDVVTRYEEEDFNLIEYLLLKSPTTPINQMPIKMEEFDLNTLRNSVLENILNQGLILKHSTTKELIKFLKGDFSNEAKKVCLQIFIHYSKMDVRLLYDQVSSAYLQAHKLTTLDEFFDYKISSFLVPANWSCEEGHVWIFTEDRTKFIRNALQSTSILTALQDTMNCFLGQSTCSLDLPREIENMEILGVSKFEPLDILRGACLMNGILICTNNLAGHSGSTINNADLITLATHETCHFLMRKHFNDFNFSSPYTYLPNSVRFDSVIANRPLEMGRSVELLIFDKVQPYWAISKEEAAMAFIDRLNSSTLPVISANEHKKLGLKSRIPSLPFGVDIDLEKELEAGLLF